MNENQDHDAAGTFRRVICELCALTGIDDVDFVLQGGKVGVDGCTVNLLLDETGEHGGVFVYADLGPPPAASARAHTYKMLLKINFDLLAGAKGVLCLHPATERVFYSFRYPLDAQASGERLLATLIRSLGEMGITAWSTPVGELATDELGSGSA